MISVDFYKEYISDLSKIEMIVSRETDTVMNSEELIENVNVDNGENIYNLNPNDEDENFLIDCIGIQWYVFISDSNSHLIKYR